MDEKIVFSNVQLSMQSHKNQKLGNSTTHKNTNLQVIDPKEMELHVLPDKEFKIIILKMLRELQENIGKQWNQENTRRKWKRKHKKQIQILQLKNTETEWKN